MAQPAYETHEEAAAMLDYQSPLSRMTLREALAELRRAEADVSETVVAPDLSKALEAHDVVHILFGLDISDVDEVVAHGWMLAGTTLSAADMHAVMRQREHQSFALGFGHGRRALVILRALPGILMAMWRARRMTQRWPFWDYERHLDTPLADLRAQFGVQLRKRSPPSRPRGPHHPPLSAGTPA